MSNKNFFESGSFLGNGLDMFAMSKDPVQLMESVKTQVEPEPTPSEPPAPQKPEPQPEPAPAPKDPLLEGRKADLTEEQVHQLILESAKRSAAQNTLSDAAEAVFAWADEGDHTYDALDGFAQAIAGIFSDEDDVTEDQEDAYNEAWGHIANFMAACGLDDDTIEALADDEDDEAAAEAGALLASVDEEDRDELEAAFVVSGSSTDEMLNEAFKKVVRNGEIKLIKKRLRKKRLTAAQKSALKKARRKAHTGAAKIARKKSMKIRRKRLG